MESIDQVLKSKRKVKSSSYEKQVKISDFYQELYKSRNFHGGFKFGLYGGLIHGFLTTIVTRGKEFWSFRNMSKDTAKTLPASQCKVLFSDKANRIRKARRYPDL